MQNETGSALDISEFHFLLDGGERDSIARGNEATYAQHSRMILLHSADKLQTLFLWELSPASNGYSFRVHIISILPSILIEIPFVQTLRSWSTIV